MLEQLTIAEVFVYFLVFCRIGSVMMMLPTLSLSYMSARSRLLAAVAVSFLVTPTLQPLMPTIPNTVTGLVLVMAGEIIIGVLIGSVARIIASTIYVAGQVISLQIGLSVANVFDPSQGTQGTTIGTFLDMIAIALIFSTNLHHIFLTGMVDSYQIFQPNNAIPIGGFSELITKTVAESFLMGIKISSPQIVVGLLLLLGAGVMGRLMPQMQVFFVMMPVQILIGFFILMITLSASMMLFIQYFVETMSNFVR
jgi:flagellar biosynthetic protein FliR